MDGLYCMTCGVLAGTIDRASGAITLSWSCEDIHVSHPLDLLLDCVPWAEASIDGLEGDVARWRARIAKGQGIRDGTIDLEDLQLTEERLRERQGELRVLRERDIARRVTF